MLKSPLPQRGLIRFYWDGASLQAHAEAMGDPSLQWLDLPALARAGGLEGGHVWVPPAPPSDRVGRDALRAYEKALDALGVERRAVAGEGLETECLRCGHGWREARAASGLALALAVLGDAMAEAYDTAFVFGPAYVPGALGDPLARLVPGKRLGCVTFGSIRRLRLAGPVLALRLAEVAAARLVLPDHGRRARPDFHQTFQPAEVEASP